MSVRATIRHRDGIDNEEVDALLEDFESQIAVGFSPESAITDIFGLEPDYLLEDPEIWRRVVVGLMALEASERD